MTNPNEVPQDNSANPMTESTGTTQTTNTGETSANPMTMPTGTQPPPKTGSANPMTPTT